MSIIGMPLSEVFDGTAHGDTRSQDCLSGEETGQISGVASDGAGRPLAEYTVHATPLSTLVYSDMRATQSEGTTTTDAAGQFSFTRLPPCNYLVELFRGDEVFAGVLLTLGERTMQVSGVTLVPRPERRGYPGAWVSAPIAWLLRHARIKRPPSRAPRRPTVHAPYRHRGRAIPQILTNVTATQHKGRNTRGEIV